MFRIPMMEVDALLHCMQAGSAAHLPNVETGSKQDVLENTHDNICLPAFLCHSIQAAKTMQDNEKHQIHCLEANLQSNHCHVQC